MPLSHTIKANCSARVRDLAEGKQAKSALAGPPFGGVKTLEMQLFMPNPILLNEAQIEGPATDANARAGG
eukprot:1328189-Heterocapsa_arctica.AAC.1